MGKKVVALTGQVCENLGRVSVFEPFLMQE